MEGGLCALGRAGPLPLDELTVPAQKRLGPDHERCPTVSRKRPGRNGEKRRSTGRSLGWPICRRSTFSWWRSTGISISLEPSSAELATRRATRGRSRRGETASAHATDRRAGRRIGVSEPYSISAIVDFPAPESPVNQTVNPLRSPVTGSSSLRHPPASRCRTSS